LAIEIFFSPRVCGDGVGLRARVLTVYGDGFRGAGVVESVGFRG
jgi:hypothetical protein